MVTETDLGTLRSLQKVIYEMILLEKSVEESPRVLHDLEEAHSKTKKVFIEQNHELEKLKTEESELRNKLKDAETAREKAEKTMDIISTQREYEALDKEIRDAGEKEQLYRKELQQKERTIFDLEEKINSRTLLIEQQLKDLDERKKEIATERTEKEQQISVLRNEKEKLTDNFDPEMIFKFERIINNKMGVGIVAIKGNVCMGCHMILPVQFANEVRIGEEFVFCPYCSRILFYEESGEEEEDYFNTEDMGALSDLDEMDDEEYDEDDEEEEIINIDSEE